SRARAGRTCRRPPPCLTLPRRRPPARPPPAAEVHCAAREETMTHELDPALFDDAAIAPETRRSTEQPEKALPGGPSILEVPPAVVRQARIEGRALWGPIRRLAHGESRTLAGPAGPIPLRIFRPERARGAFLHLHGGGWTLGAEDQEDELLG